VSSSAVVAVPNITIRDFQVTYPAPGKIRLMMAAEGSDGIIVGSYIVRVAEVLPRRELRELPGLGIAHHLPYVVSTDFKDEHEGIMLKDNGERDEDPRPGVFALTLDTAHWPDGRYFFSMYAVNSPQPHPYYVTTRVVAYDVGHPRLESVEPNVADRRDTVVWRKEGVFALFPSLVRLEDGRLATRFHARIRASPTDPTGGQMTLVSSDEGHHWTPTDEPLPDPSTRTQDGRRVSFGTVPGQLVPAAEVEWHYAPIAEKARLQKEGRLVAEVTTSLVAWRVPEVWVNTSFDNGKTWQKRELPIPRDIKSLALFSTLRTKHGLWLASFNGSRRLGPDDRRYAEVYFLRSEDDGKNWRFVYLTPDGMKQPSPAPSQTTVIDLPNGDLLAMLRTSRGNLYRSFSKDLGKTWSYPEDTGIEGSPADLAVLPDGRVLCIYGYHHPPMGVRACVSYDEGRTWDIKHELILRSDGLTVSDSDGSAPKIIRLGDGGFFAIYHITTDGTSPYIAGTHFTLPPLGPAPVGAAKK